ncbi:MAG: cell division protein FtsZ [Bacteroidales bacterium]|nr:cell division protein FtsZ [Bacteroidales bacterium]
MENMLTNIQIVDEDATNPIIKVMGVGGGGSNAVNHMFKQGIYGVEFVVVNTDNQALSISPVPIKIQIGKKLTRGRGAGNDPMKGREAAMENLDEIRAVLERNTQMLFIAAGMGGGTGTGAAPVIAKLAQEMGILTVGIVTRPFSFEGKLRKKHAEEGIEELKKHCDSLIIISNDKIRDHFGNLKFSEAFANADNILTIAAKGIAEIITVPGYVNVDFEDVKTVMKGSGMAIMGTGIAEGQNRAQKAVEAAIHSPLLDDIDLQGAQKILLYISTSEEELTMDEIKDITDYIQYATGNIADIIWGNGYDSSLGKALSVTIIATQFQHEQLYSSASSQIISLNERNNLEQTEQEPFVITTKNQQSTHSESENLNSTSHTSNKTSIDVTLPPAPLSNTPIQNQTKEEEKLLKEKTIEKRLKNFNSPLLKNINISELEDVPAYLRKGITLNKEIPSDMVSISSFTLNIDENKNITLKENNSFLHNNVD